MKRVLLLVAIAFSVTAKSQVDPAFTAKFINLSGVTKSWYESGHRSTGAEWDAVTSAFYAFFPISGNTFASKMQSMLNSPTEMAKLAGPIGFINCLAGAAVNWNHCLYPAVSNEYPAPQTPHHDCNVAFQNAIIQCAIIHLVYN